MYEVLLTKQAIKDLRMIERTSMRARVSMLLNMLEQNPFQNPPPYEKLQGETQTYSRRINIQHRLVYEVYQTQQKIKVIRVWSHYE